MKHISFRRVAYVCGITALFAAVTAPTVVMAQEPTNHPNVSGSLKSTAIAVRLSDLSGAKVVTVRAFNSGRTTATGVKVSVDGAASAGVFTVGTVDGVAGCSTSGTTVTCTRPNLPAGAQDEGAKVWIRVKPGTPLWTRRSLKVTVSSSNGGSSTTSEEMMVGGDTSDLVTGDDPVVTGTKPGTAASVRLSVTNHGTKPATGVNLRLHSGGEHVTWAQLPANCTEDGAGATYVCRYPALTLAPGASHVFGGHFKLSVSAATPGPSTFLVRYHVDAPGSGETDGVDNAGDIRLTTAENSADLAAVGATVAGRVGDTTKVRVGMTNHGPADTAKPPGDAMAMTDVTVPHGLLVVAAQDRCAPLKNGKPDWSLVGKGGFTSYRCQPTKHVDVKETVTFQFTVQVTAAVTAEGSVVTRGGGNADHNAANNTAGLLLTSNSGPKLPATGIKTGAIVTGGAVMLAGGGVLYVIGRRRRFRASA